MTAGRCQSRPETGTTDSGAFLEVLWAGSIGIHRTTQAQSLPRGRSCSGFSYWFIEPSRALWKQAYGRGWGKWLLRLAGIAAAVYPTLPLGSMLHSYGFAWWSRTLLAGLGGLVFFAYVFPIIWNWVICKIFDFCSAVIDRARKLHGGIRSEGLRRIAHRHPHHHALQLAVEAFWKRSARRSSSEPSRWWLVCLCLQAAPTPHG